MKVNLSFVATLMAVVIGGGMMLVSCAASSAWAGSDCSGDYYECRKSAREANQDCLSGCDKNDSTCRRECASSQRDAYKDCDEQRTECKSDGRGSYLAPGNQSASVCATPFGSCPMVVPNVSVGSGCHCRTGTGPVTGIAR
jgi:hypothetical protein